MILIITEKPEHNQEQSHAIVYSKEPTEENLAAVGMTMEEHQADVARASAQKQRMLKIMQAKKQGKTYEEFLKEK